MLQDERSLDIYEQVPAYPKPPLPPVPEPRDIHSLEDCGVRLNSLSAAIVRAAMWLTGFFPFWQSLSQNLDALLRRTNIRGPHLFAPVFAATVALDDDPRSPGPAARAATLAAGAGELYDQLTTGRLRPDEVRGKPAEMGQYLNLFSTNIVFDGKRPRLFKSARKPQLLVMARGRFYVLPLQGPESMAKAFSGIWEMAQTAPPVGISPAILTSAEESLQMREVPRLAKAPRNRQSLEELRHTFLTLCLDFDNSPETFAEAARLAHSGNPGNRWHYSSLQLVVFANSKACAIFNFSAYLDGNTMTRGAAEIQRNAALCRIDGQSGDAPPPIVELRWQVPPGLLARANRTIERVLDPQQATFEIPGVGTEFFSAYDMPAVPAFVIALQMAVAKLVHEPARITQFVTMSRYRCMGLAQADVTTPQVLRFVSQYAHMPLEAAGRLLDEAVKSQLDNCRHTRSVLGFSDLISLFLENSQGVTRRYRTTIVGSASLLLRALGLRRPRLPHILISHPTMFPELRLLGRPGVRLPYLKYFGLHYHILHDRTVVTIMPSTSWNIPNRSLVFELSTALESIATLLRTGRKAASRPPLALVPSTT